jgi:hypothetical protein
MPIQERINVVMGANNKRYHSVVGVRSLEYEAITVR